MVNKKANIFSHFNNPSLIKCKKAQEDSTLVWIFAVFIILIILMVYIAIAFSMNTEKSFSWKADTAQEGNSADSSIYQNLFFILNSRIDYNGRQEKIIDAIYTSSIEYLDIKEKYGFNSAEAEEFQNKNQQLILAIQNNGRNACPEFYFILPYGLLNERVFFKDEGSDSVLLSSLSKESYYSQIINYSTEYNGRNIEIKFMQKNNCSGVDIKGADLQ